MDHFRSFVYGVITMQSFIRLNSNHVCGTIAAVTKVHCLCGVSCCLAVDQEKLQGSFSQMNMRTLIKFYVLLGRSALECCKSLMEGLGTHASSYATSSV